MEEASAKACAMCTTSLSEPYINCAECICSLCLSCFAKGLENETHQNCHSYEIIKNDFNLFESEWTALEETKLMDGLIDSGHGNWGEIAHHVGTKTGQQCEQHYNKNYINNAVYPLPAFAVRAPMTSQQPNPIPYKSCEDPPRPTIGSQLYKEMAGYMPARGDFTTEYDNYAELDISHMEFTETYSQSNATSSDSDSSENDCDFNETDLKVAVLEIYNRRLGDRKRRKKILADYGLINVRKAALSVRRYSAMLGKQMTDHMISLMQLMSPVEFDLVLESLHYEQELKRQIQSLQEFRQNGLLKFRNAKLYMQMKRTREEKTDKRHFLDNVLDQLSSKLACQQWLHRQPATTTGRFSQLPTHLHRRPPPPLDITGLPSYEKLDDTEKELCSFVRLVPEAYMEFKALLISEYEKHGVLRLAQARNLIKIDVNKTRKLFDFLVAESYINK